MIDDEPYLDRAEQWDELAIILGAAGTFGLDTEFHGVELAAQSPVGRAVVHVWSVAVRAGVDARGTPVVRGWVLPRAALDHVGLRWILESSLARKAVHNQSVDAHALANHGITLRGGINTLGLVRWEMPELIQMAGRFKLKALMVNLLGREPVCSYLDLVTYERLEPYSTWRKVTRTECSCGTPRCLRRIGGHDKTRIEEHVETVHERKVTDRYPLESIVPGHPRWELLVKYALDDAVAALQILFLCELVTDPAPWPYGGERPRFSQAVEEAVIAMEAVGFAIDIPWCRETAAVAEADEEAELAWCFRWYVLNAPGYGPHRREEVDPIWSSPTKKLALFDDLRFPRSPIWKKGRVKRGDVKMDAVAMEWIGKNCEGAEQLVGHLLRLQRVRSGKKYLVKLRDSGGVVHPICGPAGDEDDRAGAVTGRLGIKGELEAQQLPSKEELDLYFVRKAIIAGPCSDGAGSSS